MIYIGRKLGFALGRCVIHVNIWDRYLCLDGVDNVLANRHMRKGLFIMYALSHRWEPLWQMFLSLDLINKIRIHTFWKNVAFSKPVLDPLLKNAVLDPSSGHTSKNVWTCFEAAILPRQIVLSRSNWWYQAWSLTCWYNRKPKWLKWNQDGQKIEQH
jgi:hypothetical protein